MKLAALQDETCRLEDTTLRPAGESQQEHDNLKDSQSAHSNAQELLLLSCSTCARWPSRSRCRFLVVTHSSAQKLLGCVQRRHSISSCGAVGVCTVLASGQLAQRCAVE